MKSVLFILLVLPVTTLGQTSDLTYSYDRFEDRTRYWTPPAYVSTGLDLTFSFSYKGKGGGKDIEGFYMIFTSKSDDWRFLKDNRLYCIIDGESINLGRPGKTGSDVKPEDSRAVVSEMLAFVVPYDLLQKISQATSVEMRLGSTEFQLKGYVRSDVRELLRKVRAVPVATKASRSNGRHRGH